MADASATLSPIDACMKEGRMEAFQRMQASLELCSRSLADYLETKRKKFPRFCSGQPSSTHRAGQRRQRRLPPPWRQLPPPQ